MTKQEKIQAIIEDCAQEGYEVGINEGLRVAHHIFLLWSENHKLKEPHSIETLTQWSLKAIKKHNPCQFCPDCGNQSLRMIEETEEKQILTCDNCENIVHVFRKV